jgi:hypothetical protein
MTGFLNTARRVVVPLAAVATLSQFGTASAQTAEAYYVDNIAALVQESCINCHYTGGIGPSLKFTGSSSSDHKQFDDYVNTPTPGARANTILSKISGMASHGGGSIYQQGTSGYQKFSTYMDLLSGNEEPAPTVPGAPVIGSVTAGNGSAVVNFTAPADDGGATISSYTATSSPGGRSASCSASPCTVTGLTNGQSYRFSVTATNEAGEGPSSNLSSAVTPQAPSVLRATLEEPLVGEAHTGVGNLRGWAVSSAGIERIEILINGVPSFDAPYGGVRSDVGGAFPDVPNSRESGFSLAYNYNVLGAGEHTITAVAHSVDGGTFESSATFNVVRFDSEFIVGADAVKLGNATCAMTGDEISLVNAVVDGTLHDLILKWRTAEQGFEIIEIR